MVIARIESLILDKGQDDALKRAQAYIDAGADGILIHSRRNTADEIAEFCRKYNQLNRRVALMVVPTTYNSTYERELEELGVDLVVYANQLLRSAYPAMMETAKSILTHRSKEIEDRLLPIKEILNLIPGAPLE
jgi:phosphoenolpyruvate phosphomutase